MNDDEIQILEKISAGLLGMTMDPRIPRDSKEFLTKKSTEIDGILAGLHEEFSEAPVAGPDQNSIAAAVLAEIRESLAPPSMPSAQLSAFADRVAARAMGSTEEAVPGGTAAQEAAVLEDSEFKRCTFGPDTTTCDHCGLSGLQLYYRRTCHDVDEGEYACLSCIAVKKARDDAEGRYIDLEVERDVLNGLLQEIKEPVYVQDGNALVKFSLWERITNYLKEL